MPTDANGTNLRTLWHAFKQRPVPAITLVDLRHEDTGARIPTLCVIESHPDGDKLFPYAFMIDRDLHDFCRKLQVPEQYEAIWDWCIPPKKEPTP
jgi:hypothetical protein